MGQLLTKPGVVYLDPIPPAGRAILAALEAVALGLAYDLTVTSAADGQHSGPLDPLPPAGQAIVAALTSVAAGLPYDLTVTSGADGAHSGPLDPHHRGEAFDVRSHGLPDKQGILRMVLVQLAGPGEEPQPGSGGLLTEKFFGWLEAEGQENEHFHFQLRHGVEYP